MKTTTLATGETLTFQDEGHLYLCDGKPMPGTHALMERHGIVKPLDSWGAPYAERGKRVDFYCDAWDEDDLDIEDVDSSERGYLEAWIRFRRENIDEGLVSMDIQRLFGSARYWYATTIDRVFHLANGWEWSCNRKTGKKYKHHSIQLWLEALLLPVSPDKIIATYLDPSGSYAIEEFQDDLKAREVALSIAETNGLVHSWSSSRQKRERLPL